MVRLQHDWLIGRGEMAEAIRTLDWSQTPLGNRKFWPPVLRFAVNGILATPWPIAICWSEELLLLYNDAYRLIAGDRHPQSLGKPTRHVWPEVWHINQPIFHRVMERAESVFLENKLFPIRRERGQVEDAWFTLAYTPIFRRGARPGGVQVTLIETTARIRAESALAEREERFRQIFNRVATGIAITDVHGKFEECNPAYSELLGYSEDELRQMEFSSLIHLEDRQANLQQVGRVLSGEIPNFEIENRYLQKSGKTVWVRKFVSVLSDRDGHLAHLIALVTDISRRKQLEDDLRRSIELRDDFMAIASHELKTPLTALFMQLEVLRRLAPTGAQGSDQQLSSMAQSAYRSGVALSELLNELLDVTQIRLGRLTLVRQEMDLRRAILDQVERVREVASRKGSSITVLAENPVWGEWDRSRITQILSNLLSNAIKYGEGKPIVVRLSLEPGGVVARLEVENQGRSVPEELRDKIFERFQRANWDPAITGLGLGLYIVRQVVEAHGGSIALTSQSGKGSLFTVLLPLHSSPQKNQNPG